MYLLSDYTNLKQLISEFEGEMGKNQISIMKKFEDKLSFFTNNIFFSLFIIGIIGLSIRILFLHIEVPIHSDNFLYFRVAVDQVTGYTAVNLLANDGWPYFLSLFFRIIPSNNFMDYMAVQQFVTIGISVLTIIPIYFLSKQFVGKKFAVLSSAIFIFEPRIAQNSLFGVTEPLYIMALTMSLALIFNKKYYLNCFSFIILSLAILVRAEAIFLLPVFFLIYFIHSKINKKSLLRSLIFLIIITSILFPMSIIRSEYLENDGITSRISQGMDHISSVGNENQYQIISIITDGIINMLKFLAWSQIPYLIFFVPLGLILIIKKIDKYEISLILVGISALIPTVYAYSFASDSRWIFPIYPIFCILSAISIKYYLQKTTKPKCFIIIIFSVMILSSIVYLDWKDIDKEHELEIYNLSLEITDIASGVNMFYPESAYLHVAGLTKVENFPVSSNQYLEKTTHSIWYIGSDSIEDVITNGKEEGLTHLVIDDNPNRPQFMLDVLINKKDYPYLIKEFDSLEHGYNYQLNIYKIDYEKFYLINQIKK